MSFPWHIYLADQPFSMRPPIQPNPFHTTPNFSEELRLQSYNITMAPHDPSIVVFRSHQEKRPVVSQTSSTWRRSQVPHESAHRPFTPSPPFLPAMLVYNPLNGCADLVWDILKPPECAYVPDRPRSPHSGARWQKQHRYLRALPTSMHAVSILSEHPSLSYWMKQWGPIFVSSKKMIVNDILQAVFEYMHTALTPEDFRVINDDPYAVPNLENLHATCTLRRKESLENNRETTFCKYKRVDIMGSHRRFKGMQVALLSNGTWGLYIDFFPGPVPTPP